MIGFKLLRRAYARGYIKGRTEDAARILRIHARTRRQLANLRVEQTIAEDQAAVTIEVLKQSNKELMARAITAELAITQGTGDSYGGEG